MLEAKTIMKTDLITVKKETPIYDAIELISKNRITGMPVVDDEMRLVGVVSEKDVLSLLNDLDNLLVVDELKGSVATVNDFMTQNVVSFDENDDLFDICDVLIENNFRRVPITAKGRLVGIITRADIVAYILQLKCKDKQSVAL